MHFSKIRMHSQILFKGVNYGPFESNELSLIEVTRLLGLKGGILVSLIPEMPNVITREQDLIPGGYFELVPSLDFTNGKAGGTLLETPSIDQRSTTKLVSIQEPEQKNNLGIPLPNSELEQCVDCMLRLIAAVPPRFTKYNKVLSQQISNSLKEAEEWQNLLESKDFPANINPIELKTFIQYRLLSMMHDIYKLSWAKYAPRCRKFAISSLYSMGGLKRTEHVLNYLSVWRRSMPTANWMQLKQHFTNNPIYIHKCSSRLIPSRLPSEEHAGDFVKVASLSASAMYIQLRSQMIKKIAETGAYLNDSLLEILNEISAKQNIKGTKLYTRLLVEFNITSDASRT